MFVFLVLVAVLATIANGNVIGLDFGSDSMKVALVQPGKPLEIVTNFESKRKTPTCITFYKGERSFGASAYALMSRKPDLSFAKMYRMLGKTADNDMITELTKQYFPYQIYANETMHNAACIKQEETHYTPEELLAMMMQHAKDITHGFGGKHIKDCVVTVPSHFTQHERRAIYNAAEVADLRILSLIEENTAAALHYGIDRVFEEPQTVLYYNMGSSTTQVSIAKYHSYKTKEMSKNKTIGQFEVIGKAWDRSLGGFNFDVKLTELLADRFNEAWSKKKKYKEGQRVQDYVLPMTKLRAQAAKVKEVLSANPEFPVRAEQLHADVDLNTKVTRKELENISSELLSRVTKPIDEALAMAGISLNEVKAVELLGGGVRMPAVKRILDEYFSSATTTTTTTTEDEGESVTTIPAKIEVGQHLNGDEAMALGAAFRAANLSTSFRVRKVGMWDVSMYGVGVKLETLVTDESTEESAGFLDGLMGGTSSGSDDATDAEEEEWVKSTGLYGAKTLLPAKSKTVAITHNKDILLSMSYDDASSDSLPVGTSKLLSVFNITGIAAFAKEHADKNLGNPKVQLSFGLDGSGVVQLNKAEATLELPKEPEPEPELETEPDSEAAPDATSDATSDSTEKSEDQTGEEKKEGDASAAKEGENSEEGEGKNKEEEEKKEKEGEEGEGEEKTGKKSTLEKGKKNKKEKKDKKKKIDNFIRKTLTIIENYSIIVPPVSSPDVISESRAKLKALDDADEARQQREVALNDLEGYIYSVKGKIMDMEEELKTISTEEQSQACLDMGTEIEDWLYEAEAKTADVTVFKGKHKDLRQLAEPIFDRYQESIDRPKAIATAVKSLNTVREKLTNWTDTRPWVTDEDKEALLELVVVAETWITDKEEEQAALATHEPPAFSSTDVPTQLKNVANNFEKLMKKKKPKPEPEPEPAVVNVNVTEGTFNATHDLNDDGEPVPMKLKEVETEEGEGADADSSAAADTENNSETETDSTADVDADVTNETKTSNEGDEEL